MQSDPGNRKAWIKMSFWALGVVLVVFGAFVWPTWMIKYDDKHKQSIQCAVTSAEVYGGSTVTRTGLGGPFRYIKVDTSDCGILVLQGVREKRQNAVAAELSRGGEYKFSVGSGSWGSRSALKLLNRYPSAFAFERVG